MTEICVHNARNGQISDGALHYVRCNRKITGRRLFMSFSRIIIAVSGLFVLGIVPAGAQETTGPVGGPDSTTTIDGRYLPPPPQPFKGTIGLNAAQSTPGWPARVVPPKGAPNILLIMTDDVGYAAPSTFGGVIPTPALDRIANAGLRFTNFHTTSL